MFTRTVIAGLAAATLAASAAYAGNLDAAGTEDDDIAVPIAPVGTLGLGVGAAAGGVSAAALAAGGVLAVGVAAAALADDDDDDDDSPSVTVTQ
ncbi:MAG: hypothetical protein AAF865_11230 [Pseudomonadota bacterium]